MDKDSIKLIKEAKKIYKTKLNIVTEILNDKGLCSCFCLENFAMLHYFENYLQGKLDATNEILKSMKKGNKK